MAKVIVRHQNRSLGEFPLGPGVTTIGRLPQHGICIENVGVSRNHAFVLGDVEGKIFLLEDMKSLNGTYVNKRRIQKCLLRRGDVIAIGQHALEFLDEDFPPAAPAKPDGTEPMLEGLADGRQHFLQKDTIYFGNSSADDIHIPGLIVGKHFASLNRKGNLWVANLLVQRFSQLKVNGEEVRSAKLNDGDELEIGGVKFRFRLPG